MVPLFAYIGHKAVWEPSSPCSMWHMLLATGILLLLKTLVEKKRAIREILQLQSDEVDTNNYGGNARNGRFTPQSSKYYDFHCKLGQKSGGLLTERFCRATMLGQQPSRIPKVHYDTAICPNRNVNEPRLAG